MNIYPVAIVTSEGLKKYSAEFQINNFEAFQKVLSRWHRKTHAVCLCPGKGEKKLAIKYLETTGIYYLARYPNTANQHAEDCFYRLSTSVINVKDDIEGKKGFIALRLSRTVAPKRKQKEQKKKSKEDEIRKKVKAAQDSLKVKRVKPQVQLRDLLKILWEKAELNNRTQKKTGPVSAGDVFMRLRKASSQIKVGVYRLSTVLTTSAFTEKDIKINRKVLNFVYRKKARTVFIGLLRKYAKVGIQQKTHPYSIPVVDYSGEIRIIAEEKLDQLSGRKFRGEFNNWRRGSLTVFACVADVEKDGQVYVLKPVDVALMNVNRRFIPISSLHRTREGKLDKNKKTETAPRLTQPENRNQAI